MGCFVLKDDLSLLTSNSANWRPKLKLFKVNLVECEFSDLVLKQKPIPCRLITNGNIRKIEHKRAFKKNWKKAKISQQNIKITSRSPLMMLKFLAVPDHRTHLAQILVSENNLENRQIKFLKHQLTFRMSIKS